MEHHPALAEDSPDHLSRPGQSSRSTATSPRVMRVFVSSTFRDMHEEREELVKRVFPELRKYCEARGVTWTDVDLRWGITDEQKAEGQVLPLCLAEIRNCRPFFIGLLGERYGWIPDHVPPDLIAQEPWLAEHGEHSVTELEILHGVLNNPAMADHAFFYFRSPVYIETLPPERQAGFCEAPTAEEIAQCGAAEAERRTETRRQKLAALKGRIQASGFPVQENYPDPQALGQRVLQGFTAVIERLYPDSAPPDPLDRDTAEHEAFAASRRTVYIGRQTSFERLDAHVDGDGPPLVVLGESGGGKSALLANWALQFRQRHPDAVLLMHYIALRIKDDYQTMVDQALMQTLAALLKDHTKVRTAYLFGSRARGSYRPTSDVDIAVTFMPATSAWHEVELQEQLATQLALPVQVVDLAHAGAHLVQAVAREGIPLVGKALVVEDDTSMDAERPAAAGPDPRENEARWLLDSAADKVRRLDQTLPLRADIVPAAVLAGEIIAVRNFLGVFMLVIEPIETLVRRVARYANLMLGYAEPATTLRAQTTLAAQVLGLSASAVEGIGVLARLRGQLAHAYWELDDAAMAPVTPQRLQPVLEHLVERASRFILVEQARWPRSA